MSGYTIGEIIVWLLLAAILGFILGWLLRTLKCQREHSIAARSAAPAKATAAVAAPAAAASLSGGGKIESAGFAKSAKPLAGGRAPSAEYTIKGNADSMYFHTPDSRSYGQTIAEVWFKTEADARAAGFTAPGTGGGAKKAAVKKAPAKAAVKKAPAKAPAKKAPAKAPAKKAVAAGKFAGSAKPLSGGRAPSAQYKIKGNEDSMIYHTPESPSYDRTIAETWFKTEAAAVAAGFRKPKNA